MQTAIVQTVKASKTIYTIIKTSKTLSNQNRRVQIEHIVPPGPSIMLYTVFAQCIVIYISAMSPLLGQLDFPVIY